MRSVVFDVDIIDPAYPDYDLIRSIVDDALAAPTPDDSSPDTTAPSGEPTESTEPVETGEPTQPANDPLADVSDACAYDAEQAEEALAQGEPPTR